MIRSSSPVHLHVNRKAPVHVHVSTTSPSPTGRKSSTRRLRASDWVKTSTNRGPWVPPPAKSTTRLTKSKMSWEGPTHRLEIEPVNDGEGTCLHVSDLNGINGSTDIILEPAEGGTQTKLDNLTAEVNSLKTEVQIQRNLRELEEKELERQASRMSEREDSRKRCSPVAKLRMEVKDASQINANRETLMQQMTGAELDLGVISHQIDLVKEALRLLIRDKSLSPSRAREVTDQSSILQDRLSEFLIAIKSLKHIIRSQQKKESKLQHYTEEIEVLVRRLSDSETTVHLLRSQLEDKDQLALHSQQLHEQVSEKEKEAQTLLLRLQSLEDQLHQKEIECTHLESSLQSTTRKAEIDKDTLKRSNKQQREKALKTEKSLETITSQVDHLMSELEIERSRSSRLGRDKVHCDSELQAISIQVQELQQTLDECRQSNKASLDKISEKNREINSLQLENERLKTTMTSLESRLRASESTTHTKMSVVQSELVQLQSTITEYEGLITDYKIQLEKSHHDIDRMAKELQQKEQEIEQIQHDSFMEMERSKMKFQKQISDMEPFSEQLKTSEIRLQESQERLQMYEQRNSDQTKMIAELSAKISSLNEIKEKLNQKKVECKGTTTKLELLEKRLSEYESQNRELLAISSKKEEIIRQLQLREEKHIEEVASLNRQLDTTRVDARKQLEEYKEKSGSKDRSQQARLADLEAQQGRLSSQNSQLRKSKEESERKLQSKVRELQERLDQCQATKKSLENYVNFLKSSYASIFNDTSITSRHSP